MVRYANMSDVATQTNKGSKDKDVTVHFRHIGELENANFKFDPDMTLQAAWDAAYAELGVTRDERDTLQAAVGSNVVDMMPYLGHTLAQLRDQDIINSFKFEIAASTGGA